MTGPGPGEPEVAALDNAAAAIAEGQEEVAEQRERALERAETDAQRDAINARFDAIESELSGMSERITEAATQSVQAAVGPIGEQLRGLDDRIAALTAAGGTAAEDADDGILSIEEITEEAAANVGEAVETAGNAAASVANEIDKAPQRGHILFRRLWGG